MAEIDNLVINVEVNGDTKELSDIALLVKGIGEESKKSQSKVAGFGKSLKSILRSAAVVKTVQYLAKAVKASMAYTENLNLFTVAMGEYADEAKKYAETVSEIMGIDPSEWLKAQGTFNILATGFGVAADKAAIMSKNLTQLGYDISSFYNISVSDAMLKLQSGLAGELEPLRRLGYDLSMARLQQEAYALGIDKSITSMTQAEKSMIRYHAIMSQVTEVQGDMSRTLESPANQTRILKAQVDQLTRSLGNVLIPLINKLLPYLIALAQAAREAAENIALFFGFTLPEVDYSSASSSVGDIATGLEDANGSAKELKRTLMGFDEINKLNDVSSGASGAGAGGGVGFDMELLEYDFLGDRLAQDLDEVQKRLEKIKWIAGGVAAVFATWKLTGFLKDSSLALGWLKSFKLASAIVLTVSGVVVEWSGIISTIKNGLNKSNFGKIIGGAMATVIGSGFVGMLVPSLTAAMTAGIGAVVAGIPMYIVGIYDALKNGLDWLSGMLIPLGATLAGTGIGAMIGSIGGAPGALVGALIGLVVGALTDLGILIYEKWDEISAWFKKIPKWFDSKIIAPIKTGWQGITNWFTTNISQPISSAFSGLWSGISTAAETCWSAIQEFFEPAVEWFSELFGSIEKTVSDIFYNIGVIAEGCWDIVEKAWEIASDWFDENVCQPIATFFTDLWDNISLTATQTWDWITSTVTQAWEDIGDAVTYVWEDVIKAGALDAWEGVKEAFDPVKTFFEDIFSEAWQKVVNVFSVAGDIFVDIKDGVIEGFKSIVNPLIRGINSVIKKPFEAINSAISTIRNIEILDFKPFENLKTISIPEIPQLASGGQVDSGQLFIAREAGAEMVGAIGRRTTVANNEQIIEGIYRGVYQAMRDANASGNGQRIVVMLPNGDVLGESFVDWHNGVVKQTGYSPLLV